MQTRGGNRVMALLFPTGFEVRFYLKTSIRYPTSVALLLTRGRSPTSLEHEPASFMSTLASGHLSFFHRAFVPNFLHFPTYIIL